MDVEEIQARQKLIEHSEGAGAESGICFWLAEIALQLANRNVAVQPEVDELTDAVEYFNRMRGLAR